MINISQNLWEKYYVIGAVLPGLLVSKDMLWLMEFSAFLKFVGEIMGKLRSDIL